MKATFIAPKLAYSALGACCHTALVYPGSYNELALGGNSRSMQQTVAQLAQIHLLGKGKFDTVYVKCMDESEGCARGYVLRFERAQLVGKNMGYVEQDGPEF